MSLMLDIKYAFRQVFNAPKFTALTLIVLVGGLSISLFTFSFLYSLIYKPLPVPNGENIFSLSVKYDGDRGRLPAYEFLQARKQLTSFSALGAIASTSARLSINDTGVTLNGSYIEQDMFDVTNTAPILGRVFDNSDMQANASPSVVISYHTWVTHLNADPNIVGEKIRLNDILTTVIGVMPEGYGFPVASRIWLPMPHRMLNPEPTDEVYFRTYLTLKPNISIEQAEQEFTQAYTGIYQQSVKLYKKTDALTQGLILTFPHAQTDGEGGIVFTFFNLVAFFILLLACINVGNLLLAKAIEKQKETAIRAAIGAPIKKLTFQIMVGGVLITLLGGLLSLLLVGDLLSFADTTLHTAISDNLPFWWHWGMDWQTVLMAGVFTLVTLFLASFLPAWKIANQDINMTLRDGTRGAQGKKAGRASRMLVTVQIFLISTLILIGSVSAFISHYLLNIETGENLEQVLEGSMYLNSKKYEADEQKHIFFESFIERLNQNEEVSASVARIYRGEATPLLEDFDNIDQQSIAKMDTLSLYGNTDFYGAKLIEGRHLNKSDNQNNRKVALVSESFVKRHWQNQNPLDKPLTFKLNDEEHTVYIVGVVTDKVNTSALFANQDRVDELYVSGYQFPYDYYRIYYKYHGELEQGLEAFYRVAFSLDNTLEPSYVESALRNQDMMKSAMKLTSRITFIAGGFALLLALTGIYGLTSNAVARRTHEVGIRRAVGATDKQIIRMFLKQGSRQLIVGLSSALFLFGLITFALNNFADGNIPNEIFLMLALVVTISLSVVVMLAIYFPTRKAVAMEPSSALRYE